MAAMATTANTVSDLVQDIGGLITLPEIYLRINRLIDDPRSSSSDIARAISQDPAFTIRLLRVANSALYSFSSSVDTVARAVSIIGTAQIRSLALSMSVAKSFAGLPNALVSMENFWRHCLYCALIARRLAKALAGCDRDAVFAGALLHDIGELVIFNRLPAQAKEALLIVLDSQDEIPVHRAEFQVMGFDHSDVGGELARQWKLPALLEECIAHHHDIARATRYPQEVAVVHIANILALMAELDTLEQDEVPAIDPLAWERSGLTWDSVEPAVREAQSEIAEIESLFSPAQ